MWPRHGPPSTQHAHVGGGQQGRLPTWIWSHRRAAAADLGRLVTGKPLSLLTCGRKSIQGESQLSTQGVIKKKGGGVSSDLMSVEDNRVADDDEADTHHFLKEAATHTCTVINDVTAPPYYWNVI